MAAAAAAHQQAFAAASPGAHRPCPRRGALTHRAGALGRNGMYPSTSIGLSNVPRRAGLGSGVVVVRLRRYPGDQPLSRHHRHHYDTSTPHLSNAAANSEVADTTETVTAESDVEGADVDAVENAFGELEGALWAGPPGHCPPRHSYTF